MVKIVPHEAFACSCAEGGVVLRQSYNLRATVNYTMHVQNQSSPGAPSARPSTPPSYSSGPSTPSSYSSRPSPPPNYSPGSSRNAECSNCKHLRGKISVLKATTIRHHENLKTQVEGLEGLDSDFTSMREDIRASLNNLGDDLKREIPDLRKMFMGKITKLQEEFGEEIFIIHQSIEDLQADVAFCKRPVASGGGKH
ncbi:hypothetical protein Tco_0533989 [Tanacetum coccineum]